MKIDVCSLIQSFFADETKYYMVVRHYNVLNVLEKDVSSIKVEDDVIFMFYSFQNAGMMSPYEPLLPWIKEIYETKYKERYTIPEFLEACGVYYLHRCVFETYLLGEKISRREQPIVDEYELKYEKKKMMENFEKIFKFITKEYRLYAVIQHIHLADICFYHLMKRLMERVSNNRLKILMFYNDQFRLTVEKKKHWEEFRKYLLEHKLEYEWVDNKRLKDEILSRDFVIDKMHMGEYAEKLSSLMCFFAFDDIMEYIKPVYDNLDTLRQEADTKELQKICYVYIHTAILMNDVNLAALAIEKVSKLCDFDEYTVANYFYFFLKTLHGFQLGKVEEVSRNSEICIHIAQQLQNDELKLKARFFYAMSGFARWRELYLSDFTFDVDETLIADLIQAKYYNSLAYIYCFGFDHDEKSIREIAEGKREPVYFNRAIAIGEYIGNTNFLMTACMKNIILFNRLNCYDYVDKMNQKRLEVIKREGNEIRLAHVYAGLGYNATIQEKFEEADKYFNESILIINRHSIAHEVGETLYNIAVNCFVAGMYKEAVRSLEILYTLLEDIKLMSICLCGASKLYALSALSYHHLGEEYNCYRYFLKIETIVRGLLEKEEEGISSDEELMHYYINKLVLSKSESLEEREEVLKKTEHYFELDKGEQYIFITVLAKEYYEFLLEYGKTGEADRYLADKIELCKKYRLFLKAEQLEYLRENKKMPPLKTYDIGLKSLTENEILSVAAMEGVKVQLVERERDVNFLRIWQEILNRDDLSIDDLKRKAVNVLQSTYGLDSILSFQKEDEEYQVTYTSPNLDISKVDFDKIYQFMSEYKHSFICQWVDKNYVEFIELEDAFEGVNRSTLIGIYNERSASVTLCAISIGDTIAIRRKVMDEKNLFTIEFAVEQMQITLERIRNRQMLAMMKEELEKMAVTDNLTGLYNRQGFNLKILEEKGKRTTTTNHVLYIDLDNFKYYNDTFGHEIGDMVLKEFAQIFQDAIGKRDYAVRYGGDEFVLVLKDSRKEDALKVVEQIYESISDGFKGMLSQRYHTSVVIPTEKKISCSIGIADYTPGNKNNLLDALSKADKLLYKVKREGKGRFEFAES